MHAYLDECKFGCELLNILNEYKLHTFIADKI